MPTKLEIHTTPEVAALMGAVKLAKKLALDMEADKHRNQPELLEVQLLQSIEDAEKLWQVRFE